MTQATADSPASEPPPGPDPAHRRAWVWPGIVIGLLTMQVIICLAAYLVATSDPSQVIVSNYHEKALAWDQHMAELRAGEALGWLAELKVAGEADMLGERTVRLSLKDAQGEPLTGASVGVSAFHFARADITFDTDLKEAVPGEYVGRLKMRKAGRWELSFVAQRGEDAYPFTLQRQVGTARWRPR
jgi:nitrogen fixation protein FixH